jgi:hypothetical protein
MRGVKFAAGAAALALIAGVSMAPAAQGSTFGIELNGLYLATSNGEWAKTGDVYMDEATVIQYWTISSSCTDVHTCSGEVVSDQGWTAPLEFRTSRWIVDRFHPTWQPCPDGTTSPGRQRFQFQATDANGMYDKLNLDQLTGYDRTIGVSGGCGRNQQTVIWMPFKIVKA